MLDAPLPVRYRGAAQRDRRNSIVPAAFARSAAQFAQHVFRYARCVSIEAIDCSRSLEEETIPDRRSMGSDRRQSRCIIWFLNNFQRCG
jgi:hypothetical protein